MAVAGEAGHIGSDLGQDLLGGSAADAGDLIEAGDGGFKRVAAPSHLGVELRDLALDEVDVRQRRPFTPITSEMTSSSLMLAASSSFCTRWTSCARSSIKVRR